MRKSKIYVRCKLHINKSSIKLNTLINIIFYLLVLVMFSKIFLNIQHPIFRVGEALCVFATSPYYRLTLRLLETNYAGVVTVLCYYFQPIMTKQVLLHLQCFLTVLFMSLDAIFNCCLVFLLFFFHSLIRCFRKTAVIRQLEYSSKQFIMVDKAFLDLP